MAHWGGEVRLVDEDGAPYNTLNPVPTSGGGGGGGGGGAVTVADGADQALGAKGDSAASTDIGTFSLIALFKRLLSKITTQFPAALTGSGNLKVSVQEQAAAITVADGGGSITVDAVSLPLPTGATTETTLLTRLSESDFDTKAGSLTETAPATDTASSGLNGRLQRIAQRLTSLIALLPSALTSAGNLKVAPQEVIAITPADAAVLALAAGATSQVVFSANAARKYLLIQNISVEELWINFGASATADTPSIKLTQNGLGVAEYGCGGGTVPTTSVTIIGATLGSKFVAKQG